MRGVIAGWRRHPVAADGLLAAAVLTVDILGIAYQPVPVALWVLTGVLLATPLALRRRWPYPAAGTVLVGGALWLATHEQPTSFHFALVASLIMLYTLLVHRGRRPALVYGGCLLLGLVLWSIWRVGAVGMLGLLWLAVPFAIGSTVIAARSQGAELARRIAAEERIVVAREMHDVIAHALSVMVVHADGAAAQLRTEPERAEQAMETVSRTGRAGLAELRLVLEVLRAGPSGGSGSHGGARSPQPGVADLADLTAQMTESGLPTRLLLVGNLTGLPATVSLGLYRIVQESLTNALRHAGAGACATVEVTIRPEKVVLSVRDDGAGTRKQPKRLGGVGMGLVGMQERANACGGTLTAGPDPEGGGWVVRSVLPA